MLAPLFPIQLEPDEYGRMGWRITKSHSLSFESAIKNLCNVQKGSFLRQEYYGLPLEELLERPNVDLVAFLIYRYTREAFNEFEPRAEIVNAEILRSSTKSQVTIKVTDKSTNVERPITLDI